MRSFLFFAFLFFPKATGFFTKLFTTSKSRIFYSRCCYHHSNDNYNQHNVKLSPAIVYSSASRNYGWLGFSSLLKSKNIPQHLQYNTGNVFLKMSNDDEDNNNNTNEEMTELDTQILSKVQHHFKSNLLYTFHLTDHKPLGCTAEESLVQSEDGEKFVFISKLVAGGYAATAGLEVGDLIVGLSGTFDTVEDIFGEGLDRV